MTYRYVDEKRLRIAQIVLLFVAVAWGVDYIITPHSELPPSLLVVEAAAPLPVWGLGFLIFGLMGIAGELWMEFGRHHPVLHTPKVPAICRAENRWWPSFTAHAVLIGLFSAVAMGQALVLVLDWHLWGLRGPVMLGAFAVGNWVFMKRRRDV